MDAEASWTLAPRRDSPRRRAPVASAVSVGCLRVMSGAPVRVASAGPAPGLDLHRQMATTTDEPGDLPDTSGGRCPNRREWVMVNTESGVVVPARCGRNGCPYCLPLNARRRAGAMAWVGCARSITVTEVAPRDDPEPWQTVRRRYRRIREYLQRESVDPGLWGVFVERGEETGMVHVHVAQRGPNPIPKDALQEASHRAGAGWTRIEKIRAGAQFSAYVGKGFSSYVGKGFSSANGHEALTLNGGRLGHFSRGFFVSPAGVTLGVRDAEKQAARARQGEDAGQWVLMREASVPAIGGPA